MRRYLCRWKTLLIALAVCLVATPLHAQEEDAFPLNVTLESNRRSVIAFDQIWWTVTLDNPTAQPVTDLTVEIVFDERLTHYRMRRLSNGQPVLQPPRFAAEGVRVDPGASVTVQFDVEVRGSADTAPTLAPFTHRARIIYPDGRVQETTPVTVRLDRIPRTDVRWWWGPALVGGGLLLAAAWSWWRRGASPR
jgi:hypothetical protein